MPPDHSCSTKRPAVENHCRPRGKARWAVQFCAAGRNIEQLHCVTLASNHAFEIARMVAQGALEPELVGAFSASRFGGTGAANNSGY